MSFKLLSSEDVKLITKGELGSEFDTLFENFVIPAIGKLIASRMGWIDFDQVARTLYFSPREGQKTLSLPFANIQASPTPQVWQDTARPPAYGADTLLVLGQDYTVGKRLGHITHVSGFAAGDQSVKVTCTAGYLTAHGVGAPDDLKMGATIGAKLLFDRREEFGLTGRSLEGGSMSFLAPLTESKDFWGWLKDYKLFPDPYDT